MRSFLTLLLALGFLLVFVASPVDALRKPLTVQTTAKGGVVNVVGKKTQNRPLTTSSPLQEGTASIPSEVFNLVKSIVGAGVLGLPAGIAALGDAPPVLLPAVALITLIGALSSIGFSTIGLVCSKTGALTYRQAWSRSVGEGTAWVPSLAVLMVTTCAVVAYSTILADTIPSIVQAFSGLILPRTTALLGVTGLILLPLCLQKELSRLSPFSFIGIMGVVYTAVCMVLRSISGSYTADAGTFLATLPTQYHPKFGHAGWTSAFNPKASILVSMLATAFMCHYSSPRFFYELQNNTMERFNSVVRISFGASIVLMSTIAAAGFATFGAASSSLILNNYAVSDQLMSVSRIAITVSLMASYPLVFVGLRDGLLNLLEVPMDRRERVVLPLTVSLLALITSMAFVLRDIRIILAFSGATWGNAVIYLFPSLMLYHLTQRDTMKDMKAYLPRALIIGIVGVALSVTGTIQAFKTFF